MVSLRELIKEKIVARLIEAFGRLFQLPSDTSDEEVLDFLNRRAEEIDAGVDAISSAQPAAPPRPPEPVTEPAGEDLKEVSKPTRPPLSVDFKHLTEDDMKATIMIESGGNPLAENEFGYKGLLQLGDARAKELGVDDPFNPAESIRGYTKHAEQSARQLRKHGLDINGVNTYLLWQQGLTGGVDILKNTDKPLKGFIRERNMKNNPPPDKQYKRLANPTVGDWLDGWKRVYEKRKSAAIDVNSYFS